MIKKLERILEVNIWMVINLSIIISILAFIFMLGLVILLHELGHFVMAKKAGILCHEFAIGMGPVLYSKKIGETTYSIRAIPIGGYVMMAGEEVNDELVKVGQTIRVLFSDEVPGHISHIILDLDDERYLDAETIEVEYVDLKSVHGDPLRINQYPCLKDALYVMKKRTLQIAPYDRSFESKTLWQRFITIFAGPLMNFILAFILFILVAFAVGLPQDEPVVAQISESMPAEGILHVSDEIIAIEGNEVKSWQDISLLLREYAGQEDLSFEVIRDGASISLDINPLLQFYNAGFSSNTDQYDEVIIGSIGQGSAADKAGLEVGDEITELVIINENGSESVYPVSTWENVVEAMEANQEGLDMEVTILRDEESMTFDLGPFSQEFLEGQGVPFIQASIGISPRYAFDFFGSISYGTRATFSTMGMIFSTLQALFQEERVGVGDLAGPVGIFTITSSAISQGFIAFINWMAILSVNLGVINLLPIPALDGGRIVFLGYEAITRKPVNKKVENSLHILMYFLLLGLLFFVTFNDILRLLNLR